MTRFDPACPVIVGAGLAGLATALRLAPRPVVVLSRAPLGNEASTPLAQGGIAAAIGADDAADLHLADTIAAGDGLVDAAAASRIVAGAREAIEDLRRWGVAFDLDADGGIALGLEAAHGRRRIVHAGGDATGAVVHAALVARARATPSITLIERAEARRVLVEDGRVIGLLVDQNGVAVVIPTSAVVIATGGVGGLFRDTTNPPGNWGAGLMLAAEAGAELADIEFVQFHPTALALDRRPLPLVSEAVRGEGAILVDETGARFMAGEPGAELAPRDVVTRRIWRHMARGHRVFLDARGALGSRFETRFPAITALCRDAGVDPVRMPIPVRPAAHYHMGGIAVDGRGRSSLEGLWAVGEASATGLHGANRLASNSLLEAAVCSRWVAEDIADLNAASGSVPVTVGALPPAADPAPAMAIVSRHLGVVRDRDGLLAGLAALLPLADGTSAAAEPARLAVMMAEEALARAESRGAHFRADHPAAAPVPVRTRRTLAEALDAARAALASASMTRSA